MFSFFAFLLLEPWFYSFGSNVNHHARALASWEGQGLWRRVDRINGIKTKLDRSSLKYIMLMGNNKNTSSNRDIETISMALTAAETGHLVFGTLHTSSAAKTIDRIVDVFPAEEKDMVRAMLSESLRAVISQVLCKKVGGGRVAAHEIMIGTPAIRNLIRENKLAQMYSAIQTGQQFGMQTLDQNLKLLLSKNLITKNDARSKAANKDLSLIHI